MADQWPLFVNEADAQNSGQNEIQSNADYQGYKLHKSSFYNGIFEEGEETIHTQGVQTGNGKLVITYLGNARNPLLDSATVTLDGPGSKDNILTAGTNEGGLDDITVASYQWQLNGENITGETSTTLDCTSIIADGLSDSESYILTCNVTFQDQYGNEEEVLSDEKSINPLLDSATVILTGPASNELTVTTNPNTLQGITVSYQWKRNGSDITGQTTTTLIYSSLNLPEPPHTFTCTVTFEDANGFYLEKTPNPKSYSNDNLEFAFGVLSENSQNHKYVQSDGQLGYTPLTLLSSVGSNFTVKVFKDGEHDSNSNLTLPLSFSDLEVGSTYQFRATYTDSVGWAKEVETEEFTHIVPQPYTPTLSIDWYSSIGNVVTCDSPPSLYSDTSSPSYQWQRNNINIDGETERNNQVYVNNLEKGGTLTCKVTYTDAFGFAIFGVFGVIDNIKQSAIARFSGLKRNELVYYIEPDSGNAVSIEYDTTNSASIAYLFWTAAAPYFKRLAISSGEGLLGIQKGSMGWRLHAFPPVVSTAIQSSTYENTVWYCEVTYIDSIGYKHTVKVEAPDTDENIPPVTLLEKNRDERVYFYCFKDTGKAQYKLLYNGSDVNTHLRLTYSDALASTFSVAQEVADSDGLFSESPYNGDLVNAGLYDTLSYSWKVYKNGSWIDASTEQDFQPTAQYLGKKIQCLITYIDKKGFSHTVVAGGDNTSIAFGDPYIYSMLSDIPVKLPDTEACYRLYQSNNTYINAEVLMSTKEHQERMKQYIEYHKNTVASEHYKPNKIVTDGYFFSKFYISEKNNTVMIDLHEKSINLNSKEKNFFNIKQTKGNAGINNQKGKCSNIEIEWISEQGNKVTATIHFFKNPHIENGISLKVGNLPEKALGLCVSNYRPKLMTVPNVRTEKYEKIKKRVKNSKNPYQQIAIKKKNEKWAQHK